MPTPLSIKMPKIGLAELQQHAAKFSSAAQHHVVLSNMTHTFPAAEASTVSPISRYHISPRTPKSWGNLKPAMMQASGFTAGHIRTEFLDGKVFTAMSVPETPYHDQAAPRCRISMDMK